MWVLWYRPAALCLLPHLFVSSEGHVAESSTLSEGWLLPNKDRTSNLSIHNHAPSSLSCRTFFIIINFLFLHIQCYHTHHWSFQKIRVQSLQASSGNVSVTSFSKLVFLTLIFCMHLSKFITFTDFMLMLSRCMFVVFILANQKRKNSSEVQLQESNANTTDYIFSNWINSNWKTHTHTCTRWSGLQNMCGQQLRAFMLSPSIWNLKEKKSTWRATYILKITTVNLFSPSHCYTTPVY